MSDSAPIRAVLIGHGAMAAGMIDAVRHITGCEADAIIPLSNRGISPDALAAQVEELVGTDPVIVFTDLLSGSCGFVARRLAHSLPQLVIVSGVNLPVLIDFVMNRALPMSQLVPHLLSRGRAAIGCSPAALEDDERRALSSR